MNVNEKKREEVEVEEVEEDDEEDANQNLRGAFAFSSPLFSEIQILPMPSSSPPQYTVPSHNVHKQQ